jgi:tRNA A-37 threonylcarbamoyl transferase component Bud32
MKLLFFRVNKTYLQQQGLETEDLSAAFRQVLAKSEKTIACAEVKGKGFFLKLHFYRHWQDRLLARLGQSKAERAFANSLRLEKLGFLCAEPVAVLKTAFPRAALLITEQLSRGDLLETWLTELLQKDPEAISAGLKRLGKFLAELHQAGIYHSDLHDKNIWRIDDAFYLLDTEAIRFHARVNRRRRLKNVLRLVRNLGSRAAQVGKEGDPFALQFVESYLGAAGLQLCEGDFARIKAQTHRGKERWQKICRDCA